MMRTTMTLLICISALTLMSGCTPKPESSVTAIPDDGTTSTSETVTPLGEWLPLFDGKTLDGWKPSESQNTWSVVDGTLVSSGPRSHLFYDGPVTGHDFKNFELKLQFRLEGQSNSGLFFHTAFSEDGSPPKGYEVQINSSPKETRKTGSLFAVRGLYVDFVPDGQWADLWLKVAGQRIQVKVNDVLLADYVEPENAPRTRKGRVLSSGTFALQAHDPETKAAYRSIQVKLLPVDATDDGDTTYIPDPDPEFAKQMDEFGSRNVPVIDYHIHLRGDKAAGKDMTVEKAIIAQAKTGIQSGVLENAGVDWPLSDNRKIREFIEAAEPFPVYIGLQVNDRDWFDAIAPELLERLDFILADTMIMNDETGKPQKLWLENEYEIIDVDTWLDRYFAHCMTVVNEPITILANPTWLPPRVADRYDTFWNDERMAQLIDAAVKNNVAIEIQAGSAFPNDKFIALAKSKGAKFTIGRNNFDDTPKDFLPTFEKLQKNNLSADDMLIVAPRQRP